MRLINTLPRVDNVSAGTTAIINLPTGNTYDSIDIEYSGATLAQLQNIEVLANGKPIMKFKDGVTIEAINDYYGRAKTSGILTMHFARPEQSVLAEQRLTALGTLDLSSLTVSIDIDAAAVTPALSASSLQSEPAPLGAFIKVREFSDSSAVAGEVEVSSLPRGPRILAVHAFKADISKFEVEVDSQKVFSASKTLAESIQKRHGRVPQTATATHFDAAMEGDLSQSLVTANANDMRLRFTLDTLGSYRLLVEYLDGFAGI